MIGEALGRRGSGPGPLSMFRLDHSVDDIPIAAGAADGRWRQGREAAKRTLDGGVWPWRLQRRGGQPKRQRERSRDERKRSEHGPARPASTGSTTAPESTGWVTGSAWLPKAVGPVLYTSIMGMEYSAAKRKRRLARRRAEERRWAARSGPVTSTAVCPICRSLGLPEDFGSGHGAEHQGGSA